MIMSNTMIMPSENQTLSEAQALGILIEHSVKQQRQLDSFALQLRMITEDVAAMRETVMQLEKVTPAQATALGQAVRNRAQQLAADYGLDESHLTRITGEIRRALRVSYGIGRYKDLPRVLFETALHRIDLWDEFTIMEALRNE